MKTSIKISVLLFSLAMIACSGPSLEKYYVDNQEKDNFIVVNVPSGMFINPGSELSEEEKTALQPVEKANILAFPLTDENRATFEQEKAELENILKDDKYKLLVKMDGADLEFRLMYLGDPEAIDEMIVYGASDDLGFGVARILGDDMSPSEIIKLAKSLDKTDLNIAGLGNLEEMFHKNKQDSLK